MLSAIDIMGIEPSKEGMAKEYTWLDKNIVFCQMLLG